MEWMVLCLVLTVVGSRQCIYKSDYLEFCIHIDPIYRAYNLEETHKICADLNSTSLEIYNESYQFEIQKLLKSDPSFIGVKYFLNLGYVEGTLMWLTSNVEATFTNWDEPVNLTSAKIFVLVADDLADSYWEALYDEETQGFAFICIEHLYPEVLDDNQDESYQPVAIKGSPNEYNNTAEYDQPFTFFMGFDWTTTTPNKITEKSFEIRAEVALFLGTAILIQPFIIFIAFLGIRYVWNSKELLPQVTPSSSFPISGLARHRYWSSGQPQVQSSTNSFVEKKRNSYFQKFENSTQSLQNIRADIMNN